MIDAINYHNLQFNIGISNNVLFQLKVSVCALLKIISLVNFSLVKLVS